VHHYAQNDRRVLPLSGIPQGNIQEGFYWMDKYKSELGAVTYPADGAATAPYPFYDRWGDSFNVNAEFVAATSARIFGTYAYLMARTSLKDQPWRSVASQIKISAADPESKKATASLKVEGMELNNARIIWEANGQEPAYGQTFSFIPKTAGEPWLEMEAQWPDGRRAFAITNYAAALRPEKK
jgi:hypothetical protein